MLRLFFYLLLILMNAISCSNKNNELINAIQDNNIESVQNSIRNGADVNYKISNRATPLNIAAERGFFTIAKFLIENGAEINNKDKFERTPLEFVVAHGNLYEVKYFIENGALIDMQNETASSNALQKAVVNNYYDIVQYLIIKGAKVNSQNKYGLAPIHFASKDGLL